METPVVEECFCVNGSSAQKACPPFAPLVPRLLEAWFERYNAWRPHEALGNRTPSEAHAAAETPSATPAKEELAA